ncbi:MAG: indolepyruvate ferredoxin oxidoreductase family protein [Myxococcota bacterium]
MTQGGTGVDLAYALDDRYRRERGRVFLSGVQALVRLPLMQRQRDRRARLKTAGFISGYRGSPLGTYDLALWQARSFLEREEIHFQPGVNEDLAATSVWGSQQVPLLPGARVDGVFALWYGKGPGVDRAGDALKHGSFAGSSPQGGVLVLTGDDHAARSSSLAHQSEHALISFGMPILNPASVQEYLDLGLYGWALSRYSGCWVGFKCLTDTVESSAAVSVDPERVRVTVPTDFERPPGGLNIGWANLPLTVEQRLFGTRLRAVEAFVRANGLDRVVLDVPRRRLGIVTTGKAYLDLRQALEELGIDEVRAAELGLAIYKVALSWPLEPEGVRRFARGLDAILVVEEKRPIVEDQLARLLYAEEPRPRLLGKHDERGVPLVPAEGELSPAALARILHAWIAREAPEQREGLATPPPEGADAATSASPSLKRLPSFCSGCPHNLSTQVPEGSLAMGGIGCHGMAVWLPERRTLAVTQMGGEGATWIGQAPFTDTPHIFQNLGDGTYFHSGLLAIRATVAAGVNITYKILVNGAVAMTGGQPIEGEALEGEITTPQIAHQLTAEGVARIAVVSDAPDKYARGVFPPGVSVHHRRELERVQRELREVRGVSALIYDQICAAEARRLRKRGELPEPAHRVVINERVCEGCGDCGAVSNCISIEPVETELGRKRRINQSSCNKDYSCLEGYCPSFVSVVGGSLRRRELAAADPRSEPPYSDLPEPPVADASRPFNILVAGIGGSGVVTVGALLGMAAHLEGKGCSLLDVTGLAQKNGPVTSHVRIAQDPEILHATRIGRGGADLVLGCDLIVASAREVLGCMTAGRTTAVINTHVAPPADFATRPDLDLSAAGLEAAIHAAVGDGAMHRVTATPLAMALLGDAVTANLFLLGYAMQRGRVPVSRASLERAIELNGKAVALNRRALAWGRLAAHDPGAVQRAAARSVPGGEAAPEPRSLEALIRRHREQLTAYQNAALADSYQRLVERVAEQERKLGDGHSGLAEAVARSYHKLLAYKDEYEVARLYSDGEFRRQLAREFEGPYGLRLHLAPQILNPRDPTTGRARKRSFGPWIFGALALLARLRGLRGTRLDPFGWTAHRRMERRLSREYESTVERLLAGLDEANHELAVEIARLPEAIRGFDVVKEAAVAEVRAREAELLASFERGAKTGDGQEKGA